MIRAFTLWNEPNNLSHWDFEDDPGWADFARMAGFAADELRKVCPDVKLVLGGISPIDANFIRLMAGHGLLDKLDVIGVHGFPLDWNHWKIDEWPGKIAEIEDVSGKEVWVTEVGASSFGADEVQAFGIKRITYPFVGNDDVVIILERSTGILIGFDPETGKEKWRTTISDVKNTSVNPVYDDGFVILVSEDKTTVFAVKASSGTKVLEKNVKAKITGKPYISKKVVYIGTSEGKVIGYDLSSKKEVMKYSPKEEDAKEISIVVAEGENVYSVDEGEMKKIKN